MAPRQSESDEVMILLVEDDELVRRATVRILESVGHHCVQSIDGLEALRLVRQAPEEFQLIIADVVMPNLGGVELAEQLVEAGIEIPVLLLSGYPQDPGDYPAGCFLQKPFSPSGLLTLVEEILSESR